MHKVEKELSTAGGDDVMEAVGGLNAAAADLRAEVARKNDVNLDEVANVLRTICHAILKMITKEPSSL